MNPVTHALNYCQALARPISVACCLPALKSEIGMPKGQAVTSARGGTFSHVKAIFGKSATSNSSHKKSGKRYQLDVCSDQGEETTSLQRTSSQPDLRPNSTPKIRAESWEEQKGTTLEENSPTVQSLPDEPPSSSLGKEQEIPVKDVKILEIEFTRPKTSGFRKVLF